ncbi:complement component C8 alpha chain [Thalassophryne amazonica]|uniref:complement component C8 alpha chain n=1 Tax=Thalassophryne amazonica TaxID=390379 RepID=UPI001470B843|nr:complement component C8 alpha chain [Thalassophryne amazonica]
MGLFIHVLLGLCTLQLFINFGTIVDASVGPWTFFGTGNRDVKRPDPISCRLGKWSPWSPCNSCTDKKFRFRFIEQPSQFGGTECVETLWEKLACPTATTPCLVPEYCGESFTCNETGRCIDQSLLCNGESDCDDYSDEDGCEEVSERRDKCSTLLLIPGAECGTQGYNTLTGEFVNRVVDPNYFGGACEYVYNGEWRKFMYDSLCENLHYNEDDKNYRKPYNYHTYHFVAQATSEGSHEYYEDVLTLLNARKTERSSNTGVTVGIQYLQLGVSASAENMFLTNITRHKSQDLGFIRLESKVQTAQFKMRSEKLMLHEDFYMSLMELPEQYDFGRYSHFFSTFGTHYVTEGSMGGTLEYVVVVNKTSMANSKLTGEQVGSCLGGSIGISNPLGSYGTLDLTVGGQSCKKTGSVDQSKHPSSSVIEDVVTLVKGGVTDSSIGVLAIRDPDTYRKWGASLKYSPTLIDFETMPIYELVRLSTSADHVGARLANLRRGWDEYLQQFHSCRCAPCRHNGIPVLTGTSCSCLCRSGYQGQACEETMRRDTKTDGSWSCWGGWSSCASGTKTRTRACNNPPPHGGGVTCLGSSSQTRPC